MKRAALYIRVSTQEQKMHGLSVENQEDALRNYCEENGYKIAGVYNDAGISARKKYTRRPALLKLLEDCKNKKIDIILFTKIDRWFRSVADYYEVQTILEKSKVPWRAIWEDYETETSAGVFKVNIMLSVAQAESDRTSERIKKVMEYKRGNGDWVGNAPTGYKAVNKNLIIDEEQREAITAFFDNYAITYNMASAVHACHEKGLLISKRTARAMLTNTAYMGNACGGKCEPYITEEQYEKNVRSVEARKRGPKPEVKPYLFSGMVHCGSCGGGMGAKTHYQKYKDRVYDIRIYECTNRNDLRGCTSYTGLSERKIEAYLIENINTLLSEAHEQYIASTAQIDEENINKQKQRLQARLQRIGDRYEDGDISREEYREKRDDIKRQIAELDTDEEKKLPDILPEGWLNIYNDLSREGKHGFWQGIISDIIITREKDGNKSIKIVF